jgi:DNA primase
MDAVEDVKARLSIEDVLGEYVELKRAGRNFKAISPWTNEKTPSLMISPEKQIWHDFSSGKGGNMFSFVMELEGLDFKGALELLARKAGIDLSLYRRSDGGAAKQKEQLYAITELAIKYYQASLNQSKTAIKYLSEKRGYSRKTITTFQLGYAPNAEQALVNFLIKRGYSQADIKSAGLAVQRRTFSDMFRGRIMVPLHDPQGRGIGFTARLLQDEPNAPKYINTPQTLLYDKSRHVYGLHLAKEAIRLNNFVVLVEGNLDVIGSHQAGVKNVVATAGTALTEQHLKALERFSSDIRLAFDQDKAGLAATERAIPIAQKVGVQLSIISIPEGKDPDELARNNPSLWQEAITKPVYVVDWLFERYKQLLDTSSAVGKRQFTDVLLRTISRLQDPVERDHYIQKLAAETDVSRGAIQAKLNSFTEAGPPLPAKARKTEGVKKTGPDRTIYQDSLLGLLLLYPITRRVLEMEADELVFANPVRQTIYSYLAKNRHASFETIPEELHEHEDYVKMILLRAEQLYSDIEASERLRESHDLVNRTKTDSQRKLTNQLTEQIRQAEARGDNRKVQELLDSFNQLIKKET